MAELQDRTEITIEDLEEKLGSVKLDSFIEESEELFLKRTKEVIDKACEIRNIKAVFISGPTSSGKTTFTMHLAKGLSDAGRKAAFLSLDDYYKICDLRFDKEGRPDFETIDTLDLDMARSDIKNIIAGNSVLPPYFNFMTRKREQRDPSEAVCLDKDGILVVEGLHGLNEKISGDISPEECIKIFIMPFGNIYSDRTVFESDELRMLRRIVRDYRHRNAHALATIDYWPMIAKSEEAYYEDYLSAADYHINSFLAYESLVIAPLALHDIKEAQQSVVDRTIAPSVFMEDSDTGKPFANLSKALKTASELIEKLELIPVCDPKKVPEKSILSEFIGDN